MACQVGQVVADAGLAISGFARFQCGEGLEKEEQASFAQEVAQTLQGSSSK